MSISAARPLPTANRILAALPPKEFERVSPHLERVHLPRGRVLVEAQDRVQHAYFPLCGLISLLSLTRAGQALEVAMAGREGMVGVPVVLRVETSPYQVMVQIPVDAMKIKAESLRRELKQGGALEDLALRYMHAMLSQITQSAVCNRFHTVEERLCRWLLIARDRTETDDIALTQEFIAHMLGISRTGVTTAAVRLQDARLIHYRRGKIKILSRSRLEAAACECYASVKEHTDSLAA